MVSDSNYFLTELTFKKQNATLAYYFRNDLNNQKKHGL